MKLISPQKAISKKGFIVQSKDRYTIEYLEGNAIWEVEVDRGLIFTDVYKDSLQLVSGLSGESADIVFDRIQQGLKVMGVNFVVE